MKRLASFALAAVLALAASLAPAQVVTVPTITGFATGNGSVTSAACSPANGVTCTVSTATSTPTFAIGLGAITPTSVSTSTITGTPTISSPTLSAPIIGTSTFAALPASPPVGTMYLVTDWGGNGTLARYSGSRWRPVGGQTVLAALPTSVSGLTNSEVISLQVLLPVNAVQVGDELEVEVQMDKSGATDSGAVNVRMGTAGTTADTQVFNATLFGASTLSGGAIFRVRITAATTVQRTGAIAGPGSFSAPIAVATPGAVTVSSLAANALYISVAATSSGATNTVGIRSARIRQLTP